MSAEGEVIMTTQQKSLWNRIEHFSLDEANASLPFSRRLARENRWTHAHAVRAIAEYKRFMFLGCVAGHPVSPSEDIDQVWHLHLAYSKSYWQDFCGAILERPFHHEPTKGGAAESAKFEDWYAKTLASYRSIFGEEPPADLWPSRPVHHELKWVDVQSHWVIPKPRWTALATALAFCALLFSAGCGEVLPNVFNLRGPDFLSFYFWFSITIFVGAWVWRRKLIAGLRTVPSEGPALDAYELAYLAGKRVLATNTALITLARNKYVKIGDDGKMEMCAALEPNAPLHPLERALVAGSSVWSATPLKDVRKRASDVLATMHLALQNRGLLFDVKEAARACRYPLMIVMLVPIIGIIKIVIGIQRDKPIEFLVIGTIVTLVLGLILFTRRPFKTPAADAALEASRRAHAKLQFAPNYDGGTMLPMAVALFGLGTLAGTPYESFRKTLVPKDGGDVSFGSSSSGCGGSCGGGCGGGGCGGCGGGD